MTKSEVKWRIRRSTLELDILLRRFFEYSYNELSEEEQGLFQKWILLEDKDWQLLLNTDHPLVNKIRYCQAEKGIF